MIKSFRIVNSDECYLLIVHREKKFKTVERGSNREKQLNYRRLRKLLNSILRNLPFRLIPIVGGFL